MAADVLKVLIIFAFIGAIVLGSQYFQMRKRARIHETIELAIRQGQPAPQELVELITRRDAPPPGPSDLKWGLITLSAGVGLAIFSPGHGRHRPGRPDGAHRDGGHPDLHRTCGTAHPFPGSQVVLIPCPSLRPPVQTEPRRRLRTPFSPVAPRQAIRRPSACSSGAVFLR